MRTSRRCLCAYKVANVTPELGDLVDRGLARDPEDRFSSACEFGRALDQAATSMWDSTWRDSPDALKILGDRLPSVIQDSESRSNRSTVTPAALAETDEFEPNERFPRIKPPVRAEAGNEAIREPDGLRGKASDSLLVNWFRWRMLGGTL